MPADAIIRTLDPGKDEKVVARVDTRLADIRRDHQVTIPLAIESGSRAWGFNLARENIPKETFADTARLLRSGGSVLSGHCKTA